MSRYFEAIEVSKAEDSEPSYVPGDLVPTDVVGAIAAVMAELPSIGKDDRSPEGYQFRGIEAVTRSVQPLLAKHGVVIAGRSTVTDVRPSPAMKDGWQDIYLQVDWRVYGPQGDFIECRTNGVGRDRSDKGVNKAQTQAYKYLLLQLLCIADGKDDADGQTYEADRAPDDRTISASNVERVIERCRVVGIPVDTAVSMATNGRTKEPDEVLVAEVGALKQVIEQWEDGKADQA